MKGFFFEKRSKNFYPFGIEGTGRGKVQSRKFIWLRLSLREEP